MQGRRWQLLVAWVLIVTSLGFVHSYDGLLVGELSTIAHDVSGDVYARDDTTLFIKNFNYDGSAPDGHFLVGVSGIPSSSGMIVPMPDGSTEPLGYFSNTDILLQLPGVLVTDLLWLSVYCVQVGANFGSLSFPMNPGITPPAPTVIGTLSRLAHGVRCDDVIVQDTKTFLIKGLHYDGQGPDAFFLVGTGSVKASGAIKVPDETGSLGVLGDYSGQDVTIRLPEALTMFDIDWLSMYCIRHSQNFGDVHLPETLLIPLANVENEDDELAHCEELSEQLQISWEAKAPFITMELNGYIDEGQYMSFGLSGSDAMSDMLNADAFIITLPMGGDIAIQDYFMSSEGQCTGSNGVCSDEAQGGMDDLEVIDISAYDGVVRARFKRHLDTGDSSTDIAIPEDSPLYVVWAKGDLNEFGVVTKHSERLVGDLAINFGRSSGGQCSPLVVRAPVQLQPWQPHSISGETTFRAQIGPAGRSQGYKALTGHTSWGIAWYINGVLIPELTVERNKTYTFHIEGGQATAGGDLARYHPFYITDHPQGGYYQQNAEERQRYKVFAGIANDVPTADAVGRYCEYEVTETNPENGYNSFEDFAETLQINCEVGVAGSLVWTPDDSTPDLVYYQCYSHRFFGWKIHVISGTSSMTILGPLMVTLVALVLTVLNEFVM